jgi:gas vesicle protein GvpO
MTGTRDRGRDGPARDREPRPSALRRPSGGMRAARRAAQQVRDLTGHDPENVVSVTKEDGGWQVGVEVLELHRVPETTDVLAVYEVTLDTGGDLVRCQRGPRYHRASTTEGER